MWVDRIFLFPVLRRSMVKYVGTKYLGQNAYKQYSNGSAKKIKMSKHVGNRERERRRRRRREMTGKSGRRERRREKRRGGERKRARKGGQAWTLGGAALRAYIHCTALATLL